MPVVECRTLTGPRGRPAERVPATITEVAAIADAIEERYRLLVLLAHGQDFAGVTADASDGFSETTQDCRGRGQGRQVLHGWHLIRWAAQGSPARRVQRRTVDLETLQDGCHRLDEFCR